MCMLAILGAAPDASGVGVIDETRSRVRQLTKPWQRQLTKLGYRESIDETYQLALTATEGTRNDSADYTHGGVMGRDGGSYA